MKKSFGGILIYVLGVVLAALFTMASLDGADEAVSVFRTVDTRVELDATISGAFERTEIDEGFERTYWELSVSYTYEGESYSGVRYGTSYKEPQLGKAVKVSIDPKNPGELLPDNAEFTLSLILSPVFLAGVTFCVFLLTKSLAETLQEKWAWINPEKVAYGLTACKLVGESYFYYQNKGSWMFGIFSAVAAAICLIVAKRVKSKSEKTQKPPCEVDA